MKSYILLLGLLLGGFTAYADSTAKKETEAILIGHVVDSRSGEHLPFITITVKGTTIGTTTDVSGHYLLGNLPVGRPLTVVAQSVGYKSAERSVTLGAHSTTELNFELEEQAVDVGEVVVEIDRNSVIRKETPSLVNILNSKLFERTNAATLADGLSFQPGVRVEDGCQNCGFAQVRINGLDGHYSQILLDSRPLFSALNGVYGLEQIPANMIERVEVIRGGGSALFGASAIGGTINIITKEPLRDWAEIGHTLMSVGCSGAYDNNTTINTSLVSNNRKAGIYVYGQNRYRSGYDHDGDGYTELPNLRNQMFGMRSYLRTGDHSKLTLEYHGINEFRRGGNRLDLPAHEANITEQTDHNINGASVAFDLFSRDDRTRHLSVYSAVQQTTRKSYYGGTGEGATDEELENARKAGIFPSALLKKIAMSDKSVVDWRALLQHWLVDRLKSDWSLFPPSKKALWQGLLLPSVGTPVPSRLVFAVDTSGSMTDGELSQIYTEIRAFRETFPTPLVVVQCDDDIQSVKEYEAFEDFEDPTLVDVYGRGGTDFRPIFKWIDENESGSPSILIHATDGYGIFPKICSVPVLWLLTRNHASNLPDWGEQFVIV